MDHDHHGHEHTERDHADHADHDKHGGNGPGEHAGHDKHAGHSVAMFRDRFWLSLLLTIPVLVWSEMVQEWLGYTAPSFPLSIRIPAFLGTVSSSTEACRSSRAASRSSRTGSRA